MLCIVSLSVAAAQINSGIKLTTERHDSWSERHRPLLQQRTNTNGSPKKWSRQVSEEMCLIYTNLHPSLKIQSRLMYGIHCDEERQTPPKKSEHLRGRDGLEGPRRRAILVSFLNQLELFLYLFWLSFVFLLFHVFDNFVIAMSSFAVEGQMFPLANPA